LNILGGISSLEKTLVTSFKNGIKSHDIEKRRQLYGRNEVNLLF
jgi:hypothetical protein